MLLIHKNWHHEGLQYYTLFKYVSLCLMENKGHFVLTVTFKILYPGTVIALH
jgi:hypothetical protein